MFLLTYGDLMERLSLLLLDALRNDPLMRRILAWEISENTEQVRRLSEARSKALALWLERMRGSLAPPKGVDPTAVNAVIIAAIQHLVLAAAAAAGSAPKPVAEDIKGLGEGGDGAEAHRARRLRLRSTHPQGAGPALTLTNGLHCAGLVKPTVWR